MENETTEITEQNVNGTETVSAVDAIVNCWRGTDGDTEPVPCFYEGEFGWPNYCKNLEEDRMEQMYENTHFENKIDAWRSIHRSVKAGVMLSGRRVIDLKEKLREAEKEAAYSTEQFLLVMENRENPLRDKGN